MEAKESAGHPAEHWLKVRIAQTHPVLGGVDANLKAIDEQVAQSSERDLVITPELATHGYDLAHVPAIHALNQHHPSLAQLGEHGVAALVGFAEKNRASLHNSAILVGAGRPVLQRKLTLPSYDRWKEDELFTPGDSLVTAFVAGTRVGTLICNDAWQPQLVWLMAQRGMEVIVVPANSVISEVGLPSREAWEKQLVGLAVSLQVFIVFANRVGEEPCGTFWGESSVYAPNGSIVARADSTESTLDVDLDIGMLRQMRSTWPLLGTPRWDLVREAADRALWG